MEARYKNNALDLSPSGSSADLLGSPSSFTQDDLTPDSPAMAERQGLVSFHASNIDGLEVGPKQQQQQPVYGAAEDQRSIC